MKAKILDIRKEDRGTCYLCSLSLDEYVQNLPRRYSDYNVQRGYVSNTYLDSLVDTIVRGRYIPPIVLVATQCTKTDAGSLDIKQFKILDGLQRTFRLHAIKKTIDLFLAAHKSRGASIYELSRLQLLRTYTDELEAADSDIAIMLALRSYAREHGIRSLPRLLVNNHQWFEIWTDLSSENEVSMMLMLNAGHKPVGLRHQLELLFINLLPRITNQLGEKFNLVRERQQSATRFAKARNVGDFHFAHMLSALLSLSEGDPVTPSADLINELQSSADRERYEDLFRETNLRDFVDFVVKLDEMISKDYGRVGTTWMGREVFLTGLLGAVGNYSRQAEKPPKYVMDKLLSLLRQKKSILNLDKLEEERNQLDLSKVNIGKANKMAVFNAISQILQGGTSSSINWKKILQSA